MNDIHVRSGMGFPSLPDGHKLLPVVAATLRTRSGNVAAPALCGSSTSLPSAAESPGTSTDVPVRSGHHGHWTAAHFGLDGVNIFQRASSDDRERILDRCGRGLLEEIYFIEKAGMAFAAKMLLLAETVDERMLYAHFAADEARHFAAVSPFLHDVGPVPSNNPFLLLVSDVIESSERTTLQIVIQVVLEGWGLRHYRALRDACVTPSLAATLEGILVDEAAHHGSGKVLASAGPLGRQTMLCIAEALFPMLRMVAAGPQGTLSALNEVLGPLTREEKAGAFAQLGGTSHATTRLAQLRSLLRFEQARELVCFLDQEHAFRPLAAEDCL